MKNNISHYNMNKSDLKKLSKSQLIKLLLKQDKKKQMSIAGPLTHKIMPKPIIYKPVMTQTTRKPVYASKTIRQAEKSVKELVDYFERKRLPAPPSEWLQEIEQLNRLVPAPRTKKPIPTQRTTIDQTAKALKGYTKSYEINVKNNKDPLIQLQNTRKDVANHIENILTSMKGLKFAETLRVTFEKETGHEERVIKTAYFNSKPQTITNDTQIELALSLSKQEILNKIAVWISEGSGWTVQSVDNHYLNVVKYEPMKGSSYIKLPT